MAELERTALEGKDRDELVAIATALGGKPASRAKKADIVDLILELTGVTPAAGSEATDTTDDPAASIPVSACTRLPTDSARWDSSCSVRPTV